jgi:single-strand DNA-binding protein
MHYFDGGNCIEGFQLATNEVYINKTTNEKSVLQNGITLLCAIKLQKFAKNICQKG